MSATNSSTEPEPTLADLHIQDLRRIRLNPGDRLAAIVTAPMTSEQATRLREQLTTLIPDTPILIYTSDIELITLSEREHPQRAADGTTRAEPD